MRCAPFRNLHRPECHEPGKTTTPFVFCGVAEMMMMMMMMERGFIEWDLDGGIRSEQNRLHRRTHLVGHHHRYT